MLKILGRVAFTAALLTLPLSLSAQLVVSNGLIQELKSKPGKTIRADLIIRNTSSRLQGGSVKIKAVKNKRDLSKFIEIADPFFNIPAQTAVRIKYKIRVPKNIKGSLWTQFVLSPTALKQSGTIRIRLQIVGYIIVDLPGGSLGLEFLDMKYEKDKFLVDIRNSGTIIMRPELTLYAQGKPYPSHKRLCFPGETTHWAIDARDLPSGRHSIIAIAQGEKGSFGTKWNMNTEMEAVKEIVMFIPVQLRIGSDIGPDGVLRSSMHSSASFGRWNIGAGAFVSHDSSRANFNFGYSTRKLSLNAYTYKFDRNWRTSLGATLRLKRWMFMAHTNPGEEYGNLMLRYQLKRGRGFIGARASMNHGSLDWQLSASLPFDFQLKFKKKIKEKKADLETIIFTGN